MTAFDASISASAIEVSADAENNRLIVTVVISQALPFAAQPGSTEPISVPLGSINFPLDKSSSIAIGKQLQEEGEKLKAASPHLEIASADSLDHAANASKLLDGVRRGPAS